MLLKDRFNKNKIEEIQNICKSRAKNTILDFSRKEIELISQDILTIVKKYPQVKKIWITGSYVYGGNVLPDEDPYYIELREHFKLKTTLSDRDYITEPTIVDKINQIDIINITKNNKILIFDNGFNLFKKK